MLLVEDFGFQIVLKRKRMIPEEDDEDDNSDHQEIIIPFEETEDRE